MKRINPNTNQPFVYGDVREDGHVFVSFRTSKPVKKDGNYSEYWVSPEKFEKRRFENIKRSETWKNKNPEKVKKYSEHHRLKHPEHYASHQAKRRSDKIKRTPVWDIDSRLIEAKYQVAAMLTRETGVQYHVDHIVPLRGKNVSGLHVFSNLRVIPGRDNIKKSNKHVL